MMPNQMARDGHLSYGANAMNPFDSMWCDEIPGDAAQLIERFELATDETRTTVERQIDQIRSRAQTEIDEIEQRANQTILAQAQTLARQIKPLVENYLKAGKLGEALAIREKLRGLRTGLLGVLPDPGAIRIMEADFGKSFLYEVTGATESQNAC